MRNRYLVTYFDNNEQETFYDVVMANSAEDADLMIASARVDYATVLAVERLNVMRELVLEFDQLTYQDTLEEQAELERQAKENAERQSLYCPLV